MTITITANIPAKTTKVKGKSWTTQARIDTFVRDEQGRWTRVSPEGDEKMLEADVIDICRKATNWAQIKAAHFPMVGFHS